MFIGINNVRHTANQDIIGQKNVMTSNNHQFNTTENDDDDDDHTEVAQKQVKLEEIEMGVADNEEEGEEEG